MLLGLRAVDLVVFFNDDTPDKLIRQIRPAVLVKGADYAEKDIVGATFVRSYGGTVRRVRLTRGRSTSAILARWKKAGR